MADPLRDIPNHINGLPSTSGTTRALEDSFGEPFATLYSVPLPELRRFKRQVQRLQRELQEVPLEAILRLIRTAYPYYEDEQLLRDSARLTGAPIAWLRQSFAQRRRFAAEPERLLRMCLGTDAYEEAPLREVDGSVLGFRHFHSRGPLVMILPRNSDEESFYLICQALLARSVCLIKTSTSGCSSLSAIRFIQALHRAIDELGEPRLEVVRQALAVVNLFDDENPIAQLELEGAVYVLFGSDETVTRLAGSLRDAKAILRLGTGLAVSAVLEDADLGMAAESICHAAAINNGIECVGTKIVYVHAPVYDAFLERVSEQAARFPAGNPLHESTRLGRLPVGNLRHIQERLSQLGRPEAVRHTAGGMDLSYVELGPDEPFGELPGPIFALRRVRDDEDLVAQHARDLARNGLEKNIVTSVYTRDAGRLRRLVPRLGSHTFKWNKPTSEMNVYLEHQGQYLLREFLELKLVELR